MQFFKDYVYAEFKDNQLWIRKDMDFFEKKEQKFCLNPNPNPGKPCTALKIVITALVLTLG